MNTKPQTEAMPTLFAYKNHITDKKSFGYDPEGARVGETPNIHFVVDTSEHAANIVLAVNSYEALKAVAGAAKVVNQSGPLHNGLGDENSLTQLNKTLAALDAIAKGLQ